MAELSSRIGIASAHAGASYNDISDDKYLDAVSGNAALNGIPVKVKAASKRQYWRGFPATFGREGAAVLVFSIL